MCEKKDYCQRPEKLKGKPQDCTPERIMECHGEVKGHPCLSHGRKSTPKHERGSKGAKR